MSAEKLYQQVKTGKVKLEQLNDSGKAALKTYMAAKEQKSVTEKYGTNEQRAGSAMARQSAEEQQKSKSLTNIVYGGTNKLLSSTKKSEEPKKQVPVTAITKIKDQKDNLQQMGLSSSRSAMSSQAAEKAQWEADHGRNIPVVGGALRGLDRLKEFTKPFADVAMELYTPAAGLSALNAATQGAEYGIARALPKLVNSRVGRIAQSAMRETAVGVPATAGNTLTKTQDIEKATKDGLIYGGGGGALLGGAGRGAVELKGFADDAARGIAQKFSGNQIQGMKALDRVADIPQYSGNLKLDNKAQNVSRIMGNIKGSVTESMTPPLESEKALRAWIKPLLDNPSNNELARLSYDDLVEIAEEARKGMKTYDTAVNVAKSRGINLEQAFEQAPSIRSRVSQDASRRAYGIDAPKLPNVSRPLSREPMKPIQNTTPKANPVDDVEEILQSVQQPRVRDRVVSFLDEQEKAALERIAKRKNNLSANPLNEWGDHAIVMAAQLGKGAIKAADFTEELVKRFGESARPHAQAIYSKTKEVLRQNERRASKEGKEAAAFNDSGHGNADSFGSKISREQINKKGSVKKWWEKTRTQLVDDMAPLEGVEKRITGGVASAEDSLYKSARMFKGTPERAAQVVQDRLSPIVKNIEKAGHSSDELGKYALARHAKDVNAAGIKSGFTNAEIDDVLRRYGTPEMEAARKQLVQVNKDMMKELVDSGVVSKELASVLDDRWKNYIPLFRAFDDESVEIGTGLSNALANVANPIKTLKGSERAVIDPLENMVKNIFQSINSAERNKVASKLHRLYEMDTQGNYIQKLNKGEEVGRKNVVNVKSNGENVKYEVEPEVYKALLNLDKESSNTLIRVLSKPASLLRAGATLTPDFFVRNPMRDVVQAFVVSKSGFNPITDLGVGLIQSISKGKLYKDWVDNLGAYGNMISMDRKVHREALEKVLKEPISKKFVNIVSGKSLIRILRAISDTTESATKVGEYRAALRSGATKQEAAYRSRDLMDFARGGNSVRSANKIIAFLNANIQGKSKLVRAIKENPIGTVTRAFAAVTVPTIGIFALNKQFANDAQKDTLDNAPDWMRNSFWLIAIPGTDVVARIPKPFDLATLFSNLPERALDFVYENDKEAFDGYLSNSLTDASLPFQISGLQPLIEGMSGYSFFREGDITPQREQGLNFEDQYDPTKTTEVGKLLAKGMNKLTGGKGALKNFSSPRVMDNTIQGYTAGLGKYATDAIDFILQKTGAVDRPASPSKSLEQKPLIRSFTVDPNQGGKAMDKFYSTIDKLSKEKASNKLNGVNFGSNNLPTDKNSQLKELNSAAGEVSDINKKIRAIEKEKLLTPKRKREKINSLIADRKRIIERAIK